jgi:hypothetical protein
MSNDFGVAERVAHSMWSWITTQAVRLAVVGGIVLVFIGAYFGRGTNATVGHALVEGVKAIGTAALASGIFAWLTKTAQLTGAIREELEQTIYSARHLRHRKDIKELWIAATRALHSDTFTAIDEKIYNAISQNYLPTQTRFYYRLAKRVVTLKLVDRPNRIVRVVSCFEAELVPDRGKEKVKRPIGLIRVSTPDGYDLPKAEYRILDPESREELSREEHSASAEDLAMTHEMLLDPDKVVLCSDKTVYYQCLNEDNWLMLRANTFVDGLSVDVHFDPGELVVQDLPVGNLKFFDNGPRVENCKKVRTNDLIFARLGIMISMQVTQPVNPSPKEPPHAQY